MEQKTKKLPQTADAGFTLVEILVSTAVFSLIIGTTTQLFFYSLRMQRMLMTHNQLINEMSYNLEHITRGLRMAKKSTDSKCLSAPKLNFEKITHNEGGVTTYGIKFLNSKTGGGTECIEYYLGHPVDYPAGTFALMENRNSGTWSFNLPLTSPEINVLAFKIDENKIGWSQDDFLQPRVTLYLQAKNKENEILENQMTISQRDLDAQR